MISFNCGACGQKMRAKDEHAGKTTKCPKCGHPVQVPATGSSDSADLPLMPTPPTPAAPAAPATDDPLPALAAMAGGAPAAPDLSIPSGTPEEAPPATAPEAAALPEPPPPSNRPSTPPGPPGYEPPVSNLAPVMAPAGFVPIHTPVGPTNRQGYTLLLITSWIIIVLGGVSIALGLLTGGLAIVGAAASKDAQEGAIMHVLLGPAAMLVLSGVVTAGLGQGLQCLRDIAINTRK